MIHVANPGVCNKFCHLMTSDLSLINTVSVRADIFFRTILRQMLTEIDYGEVKICARQIKVFSTCQPKFIEETKIGNYFKNTLFT